MTTELPVSRTGATDREVEVVAEAIWTHGLLDRGYGRVPWARLGEAMRTEYRRMARAAATALLAEQPGGGR